MQHFIAILLSFVVIIFYILYFVRKYKTLGYFVSIYDWGFLTSVLTILIGLLAYRSDLIWNDLGISSSLSMRTYLDKCLIINNIGSIVYLWTLSHFLFHHQEKQKGVKTVVAYANKISTGWIDIVSICVNILWIIIVLYYNEGTFPLLNGGRGFYLNTPISPIYLGLGEIICLCALYYGYRSFIYRDSYLGFILSSALILLSGNRGPILTGILMPLFIIFFYHRFIKTQPVSGLVRDQGKEKKTLKRAFNSKRKIKKGTKRTIVRLFICAVFIGIAGLALQAIRSQSVVTIAGTLDEAVYGNTFSDLRDGAFILYGFERIGGYFIYGKSLLAAIISFIPSSISDFRFTWSWGRYSTTYLFGMSEHFGLRGGSSMEAYCNFGYFGVIVFAFIRGRISAFLERMFYHFFILKDYPFSGKEFIIFSIISTFASLFSTSSGFYNLYVLILFYIILRFCTLCFRFKFTHIRFVLKKK